MRNIQKKNRIDSLRGEAIILHAGNWIKEKDDDAMAVTINCVWMGTRALGYLEKFNIYSWRARGHSVNIYTFHFTEGTVHDAASLGLTAGDAGVINLWTHLGHDDTITDTDNPRHCLRHTRSILKAWLHAAQIAGRTVHPAPAPGQPVPPVQPGTPTTDHIYNMVDLTKSYIGGTQRGIVLDLKVGPSRWIPCYEHSFATKFISYTRGGNTAGVPENQCIGTMQEATTLRRLYATSFETNVTTNLHADTFNQKWFNAITGYHGRAFTATRAGMDVAVTDPVVPMGVTVPAPESRTSGAPGNAPYAVSEIGAWSKGPFRVFKKAGDQTNKSVGGTTPKDIWILAWDIWGKELQPLGTDPPDAVIQGFVVKLNGALAALPRE